MLIDLKNQKGKFLNTKFYRNCGVGQLIDQEIIHNQCLSDDPKNRIHALEQLKNFFSSVPDKQQAWIDLHGLTKDGDSEVRSKAASALGSAFSQVPNNQQAWNDLHRLTNDKKWFVRSRAASAFGSAFSLVPDFEKAAQESLKWSDPSKFCLPFYPHSIQ